MNEDVRRAKMEYYKYSLDVKVSLFSAEENSSSIASWCALSLSLSPTGADAFSSTTPSAEEEFPLWRSKSFPIPRLTYFEKNRTVEFERTKVGNRGLMITWAFTTWLFSSVLTDWNFRSDENYTLFSKAERLLWFNSKITNLSFYNI